MDQDQAQRIWEAALGALELEVTRSTFETWLRDTAGLSLEGSTLTVAVPTTFAAEWLEKRMYQLIEKVVREVAGLPMEVRFQVGQAWAEAVRAAAQPERGEASAPLPASVLPRGGLNSRYTFDSFVVGPSNRLAYAAAQSVAEAPGLSYNPLFIYAGVGLGKTHLLHAIGNGVQARGLNCLYVTTEQFTNEFISAIRERSTEQFRAKYRGADVLLIDDIQFISGKEQTQEGFFHTFNDLHNAHRQIVITSDRPPRSLALLEDRLRSRFEWGLIADVQPPDLETRIAILRFKAEQLRVKLDAELVEFLARKVQKNVRELEGSLNRLVAFAQLTRSPLTVELATRALADLLEDPARRSLTPQVILEAVARQFQVSTEALLGRRRDKATALARQVAMYLLREELALGLTEIGRIMGGKDHSTVHHALGKVEYEINADDRLRREVLAVKELLYAARQR